MDTSVMPRAASFSSFTLFQQTEHPRQFLDLTDHILEGIAATGVENGLAVVASQHTTAAIVINEHEPLLLRDLDGFLHSLAPSEREYHHNAVPCLPGEHPNGHAHCQALLLSASATIPIAGGRPVLGRYQRIFLVELDCARPRTVTVAVVGS